MTDHAELRRVAALAHPDAEWFIARNLDHPNIDKPAASFIASANPKTVLALLDEIDRLKAENEELRKFSAEAYQVLGDLDAPENVLDNASDAANGVPLRHETLLPFFAEDYEALRKDAARYRWLRERDLETISRGGVFAGMTPKNIVLNLEDLDAEIDAAIEGAKQ
ncbi:hypothetical protein CJT77_27885 [Pseudomonas aeruginosa]|uniref:ead/Ea22-like family protein n=1 Tax=Pseudomonas aeruginosa TaxID=287 RepID=UPI000BB70593|nr:ead/Ea22-like family protein [Pseudomonas aeruginosa]PBX57589.1 hypothetical protein CJT77_27885 [Pseudomonas aeruginosa]